MSIGNSVRAEGKVYSDTIKTFSFLEEQMYAQLRPTLTSKSGSASITSTRRRFMLTAMAAAAYGSVGTQRRAQAAIVQTDTANLPPLPLPAGIRSRYVSNINGLTFHVLEAGFTGGDLVYYSSMDIRNSRMAGAR